MSPRLFAARYVFVFLIAQWFSCPVAFAADRVWTAAVSGDFGDPANWTDGVPGPADSATFNAPGTYAVTFNNSPNALNNPVENQGLIVSDGNVTFASGTDGLYTYHLTGAGGDDSVISGGNLTLGGNGQGPLHFTVDDDIQIDDGALNVHLGSRVNAGDLLVGTVGPGGNGSVTVDGSFGASMLNVTGDTTLGLNGSNGTITFLDGAQGSLSALGNIRVGVDSSTFGNTQGFVNVISNADITVGNVLIGTAASSSTGVVSVRDAGSTVQHAGSSSLTIGNANPSFGISGTLNVQSGAAYGVGTGATIIRGHGVLQLDGGTFTTSGSVRVNEVGDPGMNARLDLNSQSMFVQSGSAEIIVGAASGGSSLITLNSTNTTFTTGTGLLTINKTGILDINGGTFNANGDVLINGGLLDRSGGGAMFNLAPGKEMTIQNGGRLLISSSLTLSPNTVTNVVGSGSRLESTGGGLTINNGAEVHVFSGGTILNSGVAIGTAGLGILTVDGLGSSMQGGFGSPGFGSSGGTADVTFSNNATGSFTGILGLGQSAQPGTTAMVNVQSGADLSVSGLSLAAQGGSTTSATLNISGAGSSVTLTSSSTLTIGHSSTGVATINLSDGATLTVSNGGQTTLNTTGRINIDGGIADLKSFNQSGGRINFNAGSLSYQGNLIIGANGLLGSNLTLDATKSLTLTGTTTVNAGSLLLVEDGGRLTTGPLLNNGELRMDGLTATVTASSSINNNGTIRGNGRISGTIANNAAGDIRVNPGQQLRFSGTSFINSGDVVALGTAGSPAELTIDGVATNAALSGLIVGREAILQFDAGLNNGGSLALNLGTNDVFGDISNTGNIVVTGGANATFYDDVVQDGSLTVSKVGSTISVAVFLGAFSGSGSSGGGDIFFEGDLRPGASPAQVTYENNVYFGGGANLEIELGGLVAGTEHDKLVVDGALEVAGTLEVLLINDFDPDAGDSFDILDWASLNGTFDTLLLPSLHGAISWDASQLYTTGVLSVVESDLPGDFNSDGVVDAADYVVWRKTDGTQPGYDTWRTHFGESGGSGSGASANTNVPEPTTLMILIAVAAVIRMRRRWMA